MKVSIRPLKKDDAYTSVKWRNDSEVFRYTGNTYDHVISIDSELNWIQKVIECQSDFRCAILVDGVYVGNIYLTDIIDKKADYHIFIGEKNYWGRGVAKEASKLILEYAFSTLRLNEVDLKVRKQNTRAIALYTSLGFEITNDEGDWMKMAKYNSL